MFKLVQIPLVFVVIFCLQNLKLKNNVLFISTLQAQVAKAPKSVITPKPPAPSSYKIIDLGIKAITIRKPIFTIIGRNLGSTKPKWAKVQIFGIRSSFASGLAPDTKIIDCIINIWNSNMITVQTPEKMAGGFYRVQVTIGKTVFNLNSRLVVPGISHYELENASLKNISKSNNTESTTILIIKGTGFGKAHPVNFVKVGNERLQNFISWNDTFISVLLPLTIKQGYLYDLTVRNNLGAQFTSLDNKDLKFKYPGISNVTSIVDSKGKIKGKVYGVGFESLNSLKPQSVEGELFLNEIRISQIPSWKSNEIEFISNFLRAGKYLPKVVVQRREGISGKIKKINLYSSDSIYITSKINYSNKRIFGSYYALSLRESKSLDQKINNYASFVYTLPHDAKINLSFYDYLGLKKIGILLTSEEEQKKGRYELIFTRTDLVSGRYLLMLEIDKNIKIPYPYINE